MQKELEAEGFDTVIIGINEEGYTAEGDDFVDERPLPWLQDTAAENVWGTWGVSYRDVVILDEENRLYEVYNLSAHRLEEPDNYDELYTLLSQ